MPHFGKTSARRILDIFRSHLSRQFDETVQAVCARCYHIAEEPRPAPQDPAKEKWAAFEATLENMPEDKAAELRALYQNIRGQNDAWERDQAPQSAKPASAQTDPQTLLNQRVCTAKQVRATRSYYKDPITGKEPVFISPLTLQETPYEHPLCEEVNSEGQCPHFIDRRNGDTRKGLPYLDAAHVGLWSTPLLAMILLGGPALTVGTGAAGAIISLVNFCGQREENSSFPSQKSRQRLRSAKALLWTYGLAAIVGIAHFFPFTPYCAPREEAINKAAGEVIAKIKKNDGVTWSADGHYIVTNRWTSWFPKERHIDVNVSGVLQPIEAPKPPGLTFNEAFGTTESCGCELFPMGFPFVSHRERPFDGKTNVRLMVKETERSFPMVPR